MKREIKLLMTLIALFLSLKGTCQVLKQDSIKFSFEETSKIADIIFEKEYLSDLNKTLYVENDILVKERDNAYNGLKRANNTIIIKDSCMTILKQELNNCDNKNNQVIDNNTKLKQTKKFFIITSVIEAVVIVLLTL